MPMQCKRGARRRANYIWAPRNGCHPGSKCTARSPESHLFSRTAPRCLMTTAAHLSWALPICGSLTVLRAHSPTSNDVAMVRERFYEQIARVWVCARGPRHRTYRVQRQTELVNHLAHPHTQSDSRRRRPKGQTNAYAAAHAMCTFTIGTRVCESVRVCVRACVCVLRSSPSSSSAIA